MKRKCKVCGKETDMPFHTCDRSASPAAPVPDFAKNPLEALIKISEMKQSPIRSNNLYISSQLYRWLRWLAEIEPYEVTADAVGEGMLRAAILAKYPQIEDMEVEHSKQKRKLDSETVNKLKEQTCHQTNPKP